MAEQQGGAGVLGACGAAQWARRKTVFLCPPPFAELPIPTLCVVTRAAGGRWQPACRLIWDVQATFQSTGPAPLLSWEVG